MKQELHLPFSPLSVKKSLAALEGTPAAAAEGIGMPSLVKLYRIKAVPPSLKDNRGDLDRLKKALAGSLQGREPIVPLQRIGPVAAAFRQAGFSGYGLVADYPAAPRLVDFYGEAPAAVAGIALDLGIRPGELAKISSKFGQEGININYVYGSVSSPDEKCLFVFCPEDIEQAAKIFK